MDSSEFKDGQVHFTNGACTGLSVLFKKYHKLVLYVPGIRNFLLVILPWKHMVSSDKNCMENVCHKGVGGVGLSFS